MNNASCLTVVWFSISISIETKMKEFYLFFPVLVTLVSGLIRLDMKKRSDKVNSISPLFFEFTFGTNNLSSKYSWNEVVPFIYMGNNDSVSINTVLKSQIILSVGMSGFSCRKFLSIPVFVSMTTISSRLPFIFESILSILRGMIYPTKIFLFVSQEAYLLDEGISSIPQTLLALSYAKLLTIVFTNNIGPHRKLLPLLHKYLNKKVIIITLDDDIGNIRTFYSIYHLIKYYIGSDKESIISLRTRRIGICNHPPFRVVPYNKWTLRSNYGDREMLNVPTGTGGILYHSSFFNNHEVIFDDNLRKLTYTSDDLMFRLVTMMNNISVILACKDIIHKNKIIFKCPISKRESDLIDNYENKTKNFHFIFKNYSNWRLQGSQDYFVHNLLSTIILKNSLVISNHSVIANGNYGMEKMNSSSTLFLLFNSIGFNDKSWSDATRFLLNTYRFDINDMIRFHNSEREIKCYNFSSPNINHAGCSFFNCDFK